MSERMVIVIEYEVEANMQQALTEAVSQLREGSERLNPDHIKIVQVHVGIEEFVDRVLDVFTKEPADE